VYFKKRQPASRKRRPLITVMVSWSFLTCFMFAAARNLSLGGQVNSTIPGGTAVKGKTAMQSGKIGSATITLGAGCFWCTEAVYRLIDGVTSVKVGYMGGRIKNPTYEQVCTGGTGHAEVAEITYDPRKVSLERILEVFWTVHDPTSLNRQGADVGTQYRSVIFYHSGEQKSIAEKSRDEREKKIARRIVTEIVPAAEFYEAENYHQEYYRKNPNAAYCRLSIKPKLDKFRKE
jgi:peptide-methionine (S)-S-oxide reductase